MNIVFEGLYYAVFLLAIYFVVKKENHTTIPPKPIKISAKVVLIIFAIVFGSRIILYLIDWGFTHVIGFPRSFLDVWKQWDANAYLHIADSGYFNEAEGWIRLVFYPLYPAVVWLFKYIFVDSYVSALITSWACLSIACVYLYKLVILDYDNATAKRAVKYLLIFPTTVFLGAPYTEAMFLMFCFGCIYYTRLQNYSKACIFGFLAALTRNVGVLLIVFVFMEILYKHRYRIKSAIKDLIYLLIILIGPIVYLAINQLITGDPFAFMALQKSHWNQEFGDYANTLSTTFSYLTAADVTIRRKILLWGNQFITLLIGGISLPIMVKKTRGSYGAYSIAYIFVIFSPTWLLSGLRYYMGLAPLYPALAVATRRRWLDITLTTIFIISAVVLSCFYSIQNEIM